jgi:DNA topoisomerase-1
MTIENHSHSEIQVLTQLVHNGILIPPAPESRGLVLTVRGQPIRLTPKQEEMALAWAKKQGTEYVEDRVFVRNFLLDLSAELGLEPLLSLEELDFTPAIRVVEAERAAKERLSREERKAQAALRKAQREALKEQYGQAIVNGQCTELGTYLAEPSGIFMGRGKHPLRGRWKEGAQQSDVTLNLSPDAPHPPGNWQEIVWQPEDLWVARWKDRLSGKMKYIWLGDTALVKQAREASKFDKAIELQARLESVRAHIEGALSDSQATCTPSRSSGKRRMIATACYLIDILGLRVGDEKDPDEADTVGATTLRPEHVTLHDDGSAEFRFLGKDSVAWHKKLALPEPVYRNLQELMETARPPKVLRNGDKRHPTRDKPQIFPDISSQDVNAFLSELLPGLTAKVFRTHHATQLVRESLAEAGIKPEDPEHEKWQAANLANVQAAVFCNHTKKATGNWRTRRVQFALREGKAQERVQKLRTLFKTQQEALRTLRQEAREKAAACSTAKLREKKQASYRKKIERAQRAVATAQQRLRRAELALGKIKAQYRVTREKRDWNLNTSLKSYIDPRILYRWGQDVEYDVLGRFYPATLRRKFSWVREPEPDSTGQQPDTGNETKGQEDLS